MQQEVIYEQPLTERIRTFLRLEYLLRQAENHVHCDSRWDSHATVVTLIDMLNILGRSDIKSELLKELERLGNVLHGLEQNPQVDAHKLRTLADDLDILIDRLYALQGPLGSRLKKNEMFNSVRQRIAIPGGNCDFDLPTYHFWLSKPTAERRRDLQEWLDDLDPLGPAIKRILGLIRDSSGFTYQVAEGGFFQQTLDPTLPCLLIRVALPQECPYYAEISGGKHRFSVRFLEQKIFDKDAQVAKNIEFRLTCCTL